MRTRQFLCGSAEQRPRVDNLADSGGPDSNGTTDMDIMAFFGRRAIFLKAVLSSFGRRATFLKAREDDNFQMQLFTVIVRFYIPLITS